VADVRLIAAPTGSGKTYTAARHVAQARRTTWLCERDEDVEAATRAIEAHGGRVGRVVPLDGQQPDGTPNCLYPDVINLWQAKGYNYRLGFCASERHCERAGEVGRCPFLRSLADLEDADTIVATKAMARAKGFFSQYGNPQRDTVIIDEDPVSMLRPPVGLTRDDLQQFQKSIKEVIQRAEECAAENATAVARHEQEVASWLWDLTARQAPDAQPEAVSIPEAMTTPPLAGEELADGRHRVDQDFRRQMRRNPRGTVRNVSRDLRDLARAAGRTVFATAKEVTFHLRVTVPRNKRVFVLDATANADILRPLFAPRDVRVELDEPVAPAGRVIQFMDFNGPRSYLNKLPKRVVRTLDAIGELHPKGGIVLISHASCVEGLKDACRHRDRIRTAYFGALRGRNDLESTPEDPIACHVVVGSPKTAEEGRRQIALAVYGESILPFPELKTLYRGVVGQVPPELLEGDEAIRRVWEVRVKGYDDPRMQAVYNHTVTAELTQAADRARVLIHNDAIVYLVTNEPCPKLWFAEMCFAEDLLDLSGRGTRADFGRNYAAYEDKARELLEGDRPVGNANVCRALGRNPGWGKRYWNRFLEKYGDALEGERKVRWKEG
jgi:hypothetical protein